MMHNKIVLALIFLITPTLFSPFLFGMDCEQKSNIIQDVLLQYATYDIPRFNHATVCALALVNKQWNTVIKNTAAERKKYFSTFCFFPFFLNLLEPNETWQSSITTENSCWHQHGTTFIYCDSHKSKTKGIFNQLHVQYLKDTHIKSDASLFIYKNTWNDQKTDIVTKPFFNKKGDACIHISHKHSFTEDVFEYSLNFNLGTHTQHTCITDLKQNNRFLHLIYFKRYPVLLDAFLNSTNVHKQEHTKMYKVAGITLDETYADEGIFPDNEIKETILSQCMIKKSNAFKLIQDK